MTKRVIISDKGAEFIRKGQMWMFRNNLEGHDENINRGDIVDIYTNGNEFLGRGYYSDCSHIVVRILTRNKDTEINRDFYAQRIRNAIEYRITVESENFDNCRLIFGEADQLPGLLIDRYNDILVAQVSAYGVEIIKDMLYELVEECLKEKGVALNAIYERNDVAIRSKEGLETYKGFYKGHMSPVTIINENGLKLYVDVENGQKTGYFLDQKANRYLLRKISHGKTVCDCFSHTGGFALNAALGNAKKVTAVDVSKTALDQGYANAVLNNLQDRIEFVQADVFEYLDELKEGQFDIIVLDPPAFTKSRKTVDRAYGGYKRINMQAMKVLRKGGYLITCSCSRYMEAGLFEDMLKEAADEAGVLLKQVAVTQQNADHPILWNMNESYYLKYYVFQVLEANS